MRRRAFIVGLGGAAAWPLAARGQQSPIPVVGLLAVGAPSDMYAVSALGRGLSEAGYVEGKNVAIEYCWGENDVNRLAKLATDLVNRRVAVMVAGGAQSALTAKAATQTIPIVFAVGGDPVKLGLVTSLSRPEYNLTGVVFLAQLMESKRLSLLHDMVPQARRIALLLNPKNPSADTQLREADEATHVFGLELNVQHASTSSEIDQAFPAMVQAGARGLLVAADPFFNSSRAQLIAQAERYKLPAMYEWREFPEAGGLMSYGTRLPEAFRQAGLYVAQILKGAKPADLPVQQLTKFELVINLNTAKALGIEVPPSLSARADEVIE